MNAVDVLNLAMRWLHVASAITAVGATVFLRLVLVPSLAELDDESRSRVLGALSRRLRLLIHAAIGGLLVSGLYNTHLLWRTTVAPYPAVYAVKVALALVLFAIAILLTSSSPRRAAFQARRRTWLGVNLVLAAAIVLLSAYLRTLHSA